VKNYVKALFALSIVALVVLIDVTFYGAIAGIVVHFVRKYW